MDMQTYKGEVLKYALKDIIQAKARVTMKRALRKKGIEIPNDMPTKTLELLYNAYVIRKGK